MIVSIVDYGTGNLHSLEKALEAQNVDVRVDDDPAAALSADAMILPGVGAFGAAAARLEGARDQIVAALANGFPCLGICLGMQLLFSTSDESSGHGLGFVAGHIRRLRARRAPQMGWNDVEVRSQPDAPDPLFTGTPAPVVYFANSYVPEPLESQTTIAWTRYENDRFAAAVRRERTWGVQFHPEKSAEVGLRMIGNFIEAAR